MTRSHVFIANSILNRFTVRNSKNQKIIFYYDFIENRIKSKSSKSFNRDLNYYSNDNEMRLKKFSEDKIGNAISFLEREYSANGINFTVPENIKKDIIYYVSYQLIRDEYMVNKLKEMSTKEYNLPFLSIEEREKRFNSFIAFNSSTPKEIKNSLIEAENVTRVFYSSISKLGLVIKFNDTNKNFLIISSPVTINPHNHNYFIMNFTLTPRIIVSLCNKGTLKNLISFGNDVFITNINKEEIVLDYNKMLFKAAKNNRPYIIAGFEKDIEDARRVRNK